MKIENKSIICLFLLIIVIGCDDYKKQEVVIDSYEYAYWRQSSLVYHLAKDSINGSIESWGNGRLEWIDDKGRINVIDCDDHLKCDEYFINKLMGE